MGSIVDYIRKHKFSNIYIKILLFTKEHSILSFCLGYPGVF